MSSIPTKQKVLTLPMPLMGLVVIGLLLGLWGALEWLGWGASSGGLGLSGIHGPLMIGGVLGTLISLERAAAIIGLSKTRFHWAILVPALCGLGGLALILFGIGTPARLLLPGCV